PAARGGLPVADLLAQTNDLLGSGQSLVEGIRPEHRPEPAVEGDELGGGIPKRLGELDRLLAEGGAPLHLVGVVELDGQAGQYLDTEACRGRLRRLAGCPAVPAAGAGGPPGLEGRERLLEQADEDVVGALGKFIGPGALPVADGGGGKAVRVVQAAGDRRRLGEGL